MHDSQTLSCVLMVIPLLDHTQFSSFPKALLSFFPLDLLLKSRESAAKVYTYNLVLGRKGLAWRWSEHYLGL